MSEHTQPARVFRPDPHDYDHAQQELDTRGRTMQDFLQATVRWLHTEPDTALATLAPMWPPARFAGRPALAVVYAMQDEHGDWHGQPNLLPPGRFQRVSASHPFEPADELNPWYGQRLEYRCGDVAGELADADIGPYAVRVVTEDQRELAMRITHVVQDVLFGPRFTGTLAWEGWMARREQRQRELNHGQPSHS
jgi:hypothetical protein